MESGIKRLKAADLSWLLTERDGTYVSIYAPVDTGSCRDVLARLIEKAGRELEAYGLSRRRNRAATDLIREAASGIDEELLTIERGISAFTDGKTARIRTSEIRWEESVSVGAHYVVMPAIPVCQQSSKPVSTFGGLNENTFAGVNSRYRSLKAAAQSSSDENELLDAAKVGRVGELLLRGDLLSAAAGASPEQGADGTGNMACISTLRYGGNVHFVPDEYFPEAGSTVAATYRY